MAKKRGNGEGTIVKRRDGRWMAALTLGRDPQTGVLKRVSFYGKTRTEVATKLAQEQARRTEGSAPKPRTVVRRRPGKPALYFARCGDAVKIGVSVDPKDRLATLQTGALGPVTLLVVFPHAGQYETFCHDRLAHVHLHGEWFRYTADVGALVQELLTYASTDSAAMTEV